MLNEISENKLDMYLYLTYI